MANYLKDLVYETGFFVTAVLDGNTRPQSKRDSFDRRFKQTMNLINGPYCRHAAMVLATKENRSNEEAMKLNTLNLEAKKLESEKIVISSHFYSDLTTKLEYIDAHKEDGNTGGYVNKKIFKAEYQADYIMAHRFLSNGCDMLLSTDNDFSTLAGPRCICLKIFKVVKEKKDSNLIGSKKKETESYCLFEIGGGSNVHMNELESNINAKYTTSAIRWIKALHPILDVKDEKLRALFVVGIGCDVFPGVKGVTPRWIDNVRKKLLI